MTEILSAEEVARWLANVDYEYPGAADALAEHDDALRRRLAEVEAERDQLGVLYRKADAGRRTESRRLAEVEQALRVAAEHGVMTTDPEEVPWLIDQWLIRARAVLNNGGSRPMTEILSAEEVVSERYRYPDSTTEDGANDVIALCESHEALRARLAEVEAERDEAVRELDADDYEDQVCARVAAERRLAEVEQALREAKEALDKTVPVLLTVKPNLDRPYPDALTLTPWTRWCEPLARRVDDARRSARAVLDKGEPTDG